MCDLCCCDVLFEFCPNTCLQPAVPILWPHHFKVSEGSFSRARWRGWPAGQLDIYTSETHFLGRCGSRGAAWDSSRVVTLFCHSTLLQNWRPKTVREKFIIIISVSLGGAPENERKIMNSRVLNIDFHHLSLLR